MSTWKPQLLRRFGEIPEKTLKIPHVLQKLDGYNERLRSLEQTTLAVRRDRGDLIQTYKLIKKIVGTS